MKGGPYLLHIIASWRDPPYLLAGHHYPRVSTRVSTEVNVIRDSSGAYTYAFPSVFCSSR